MSLVKCRVINTPAKSRFTLRYQSQAFFCENSSFKIVPVLPDKLVVKRGLARLVKPDKNTHQSRWEFTRTEVGTMVEPAFGSIAFPLEGFGVSISPQLIQGGKFESKTPLSFFDGTPEQVLGIVLEHRRAAVRRGDGRVVIKLTGVVCPNCHPPLDKGQRPQARVVKFFLEIVSSQRATVTDFQAYAPRKKKPMAIEPQAKKERFSLGQ